MTDRDIAALRFQEAFEAGTRAIPPPAVWTAPDRSRPITPVLPGGRLYNTYRTQLDDNDQIAFRPDHGGHRGRPRMPEVVGPYMAMHALPASLNAVQPRAREIYASGWRPPVPEGPTRDELAGLITAVARSHIG